MKIILLSDTHGYLDERMKFFLSEADEIWHAGDFGANKVADQLLQIKPFKGVYGNIDGNDVRKQFPKNLIFINEGVKVLMTHIAGSPGKYNPEIRELIGDHKPDILVCGHSHILKIGRDPLYHHMLHINPGAAGRHGFHQTRTMVRMELMDGKPTKVEVIELGPRSRAT